MVETYKQVQERFEMYERELEKSGIDLNSHTDEENELSQSRNDLFIQEMTTEKIDEKKIQEI